MNFRLIGLATILLAGCSNTSNNLATHYWQSDKASAYAYRVDERSCHSQTGAESSEAFDAGSSSYEDYEACMIERGYSLRTY